MKVIDSNKFEKKEIRGQKRCTEMIPGWPTGGQWEVMVALDCALSCSALIYLERERANLNVLCRWEELLREDRQRM